MPKKIYFDVTSSVLTPVANAIYGNALMHEYNIKMHYSSTLEKLKTLKEKKISYINDDLIDKYTQKLENHLNVKVDSYIKHLKEDYVNIYGKDKFVIENKKIDIILDKLELIDETIDNLIEDSKGQTIKQSLSFYFDIYEFHNLVHHIDIITESNDLIQ